MTCDNCHCEIVGTGYHVEAHRIERDRRGNVTGVVDIVHCAECIQKEQKDGADNVRVVES